MMDIEVRDGCKHITVTAGYGGAGGGRGVEYKPGIIRRIKLFFLRLRGKYPPTIPTDYGPMTESARRQAALNMIEDSNLRAEVLQLLVRQAGSWAQGLERARRHYPEVEWPKQ